VGQQLVVGAIDPKQVLRILGPRQTQIHLVSEIQEVYRMQGVSIHDKHIEIIVRQMLKRITVLEPGDTDLLPGELVERGRFEEETRRVVQVVQSLWELPKHLWQLNPGYLLHHSKRQLAS
jgi:DNA-directed RNA polymerase subunit beta'